MKGQVTVDTVLEVPANAVWDVYRGLELGRLVDQLLPDVIGRVQVVEGDGGVGTVVKVSFPPGNNYCIFLKNMIHTHTAVCNFS